MRELSDRIAALSPEQRALLAARLRSSGVGGLDAGRIPRRAQAGPVPLSFAQQRLWFLQRLEPGSAAYNIPFAARLTGALDVAAMHGALQTIVDRHESLRTIFTEMDDTPVQVVAGGSRIPLPVVDLERSPEPERELRRLAGKEARAPFDLENGPLLRSRLLRLAPEEHVLLLTVHHIASDGWSMGVLLKELAALYRAGVTGEPAPLPELPLQYADYAVWQRRQLQSDRMDRQLAYWKERLADAPAVLELPTEPPGSSASGGRATKATIVLPKPLADALKELSRREGVTLFMTLLAAFKIVLARHSGQDDIVVGTPIAGRSHTELEGLIGCFLNTLVLRTDLSGELTFTELLARVRETALGAYANQELPFERLVEELQPTRSLGHNPLFQVLFQAGNTPGGALKLPGLEVGRVKSGGLGAKFDLSFRIRERPNGLSCICAGRADRFGPETLAHLLDQFRALLDQIVTSPESSIRAYSLVTDRSRALLPDPRVALAEPAYPLVSQAVHRVAIEAPSRIAIEQAGRRWTYGELWATADALARKLEAGGLRQGGVVALSGPPSFGLITAMLGILSGRGVMLPVATDLPSHRKRVMLQEARASLLLQIGDADDTWAQDLTPAAALRICEHTGRVDGATLSPPDEASAPGAAPGPDDPAYIFFTSGTTGTPRAVLGVHKGLSHFLAWQSRTFAVGPGDRCAQLTNISFDVVLRDVLMPLWSGATLCLPAAELPSDRVLAWLGSEAITVAHTVPSLAQAWLAQAPAELSLPSLRWVFSAGEPLTDGLVLGWRQVASRECGIVNLYGPTETTMARCYYRVPEEVVPGVQPIGAPLPESQALVLTSTNLPCGVNELGEIVLRTPFRTRGYINAAEAQDRQFLPNPFGGDPGDVLYRTGDLGRYRPDGSLALIGRLDQQVKIRGVRIEPEEITAVLSRQPAVSACAVVARGNIGREPTLVAYVVAAKHQVPAAELRAFLAERLPGALVPSTFVFLDRLPLTPNGKLDRRALPAPEEAGAFEQPYVAPRTPIESLLAGMWAEVLGVPRVGVNDDFFGLGGHSLKATQIIARARATFRLDLPLRSLFETPTVAGLSLTVARHLLDQSGAGR
ncbi:MAG: amino acid adenylation domain-containing protein [Gemmatimonadales bacterium]